MSKLHKHRVRPEQDLPEDVYVSLVDSLFVDSTSMLVGAICTTAAAAMTAWRTGLWWFWALAIALTVVALVRAWDMRRYARRTSQRSAAATRRWELHYLWGGGVYAFLHGVWCYLAFATTTDPVVQLLSTAVTLGSTSASIGRNSGRSHIISIQIVCACGPLSLALLTYGDIYYAGIGAMLILFFTGIKRISASLHVTNLKALIATREVASLASRFDTALNNMPLGLCMFDA